MIYFLFYLSVSLLQTMAARKNISIEHQLLVGWEMCFIWAFKPLPQWCVTHQTWELLSHLSVHVLWGPNHSLVPNSLTVEHFRESHHCSSRLTNIIDGAGIGVPHLHTHAKSVVPDWVLSEWLQTGTNKLVLPWPQLPMAKLTELSWK